MTSNGAAVGAAGLERSNGLSSGMMMEENRMTFPPFLFFSSCIKYSLRSFRSVCKLGWDGVEGRGEGYRIVSKGVDRVVWDE